MANPKEWHGVKHLFEFQLMTLAGSKNKCFRQFGWHCCRSCKWKAFLIVTCLPFPLLQRVSLHVIHCNENGWCFIVYNGWYPLWTCFLRHLSCTTLFFVQFIILFCLAHYHAPTKHSIARHFRIQLAFFSLSNFYFFISFGTGLQFSHSISCMSQTVVRLKSQPSSYNVPRITHAGLI